MLLLSAPSALFQCSSASRKFLNQRPQSEEPQSLWFQCSSASRKFLNTDPHEVFVPAASRFQCSSASRKFLNRPRRVVLPPVSAFQCSSASRKFLNVDSAASSIPTPSFQCSSASRKFLNVGSARTDRREARVSVLFSEPKIPQCSSTGLRGGTGIAFQCSSASRKFLNRAGAVDDQARRACFSALQRAENSSIATGAPQRTRPRWFQCSSASRKFLNVVVPHHEQPALTVSVLFSEPKIPQWSPRSIITRCTFGFSALQRAENSSIESVVFGCGFEIVSVLFSEPKIPQYPRQTARTRIAAVSVLFSEPKIPQSKVLEALAEATWMFQCSSASRKFLNFLDMLDDLGALRGFSALQRAENSSIPTLAPASIHISDRDDLASSFLSLPGASP